MRKQRRYSIDKRVTSFFLGLFIVAAGLATYYFFSFADAYYDNGQRTFLEDAEDAVKELDESVSILEHQLEWLSNSANDTTYWLSGSQYERMIHMRHMTENLRSFLQTSPSIEAVMITQRNSDVVWESHSMEEESFLVFLDTYGRGWTTRQHLPAVMYGRGDGEATHWIFTNTIVCYREDQMVGQVVADIYVAIDPVSILPQTGDGNTYLLCTRTGDSLKVIASSGADAARFRDGTYPVPRQTGADTVTIDSVSYSSYYGIPEADNLHLLVLRPRQDLMITLRPMLILGLVLISVLLLIVVIGSRVINSYIRTPLDRMMKDLERIAGGDTDYRLEPAEAAEVLKVTTGVNTLLDELNKHSATIMDQQKELYEMQLLNRESQLRSLQAQINPHFLYNTLECIRSISQYYGVSEISKIITGMIHIYRYSASNVVDGTLESEFACAEAYAQIVQVRYEGRYEVELEPDPQLKDCYMPKMILQPLIENAVGHGLAKRFSGGKVRVTVRREGEDVQVTVWDNGEGIAAADLEELRLRLERGMDTEGRDGSIGLHNVHTRIRKTFGGDYGVTIDSRDGEGTSVYVRFPGTERRGGK